MPIEACPFESQHCKYSPNCYSDEHHLAWPERDYQETKIARAFRELSINRVMMCRYLHDQEHRLEPPEMPSEPEMIEAIIESGDHIPRALADELKY